MAEPRSISLKQVTAAAEKAVARVVEHQKLGFKPPYTIGFLPPWWIGIVLRDLDDKQTRRVAADVFKEIAGQVPGIDQGSKPGAHIDLNGGFTTVGFIPPIDVLIKG